ncbi:hypothetical protein C8J27_101727 [Rhodobacter aestuarii]|uniref:Uncharacterized protein n=1 Tax=Rhodobacter aestuarii TaxID=453582 RepID=A0A1N7P5U4_9RHOB|nr:hypothetical protein [Rhodobacter aestuarii]PTV97610.1 hypothetical protein C8J27_101727 [Rhodobacter aestuarii]SIT05961.1 hypothetical protein SAMN05421580_10987 [Rhodobacter aestuarii]
MRALITAALVALASPAAAGVDVVSVGFGFFPKGTSCQVFNTSGKVTMREGRDIKFKIKGDTARLAFRCTQPDGRSFEVNVGRLLPQGNHRRVSMQINQDNHAHVFWDDGGLRKSLVPGILVWR